MPSLRWHFSFLVERGIYMNEKKILKGKELLNSFGKIDCFDERKSQLFGMLEKDYLTLNELLLLETLEFETKRSYILYNHLISYYIEYELSLLKNEPK